MAKVKSREDRAKNMRTVKVEIVVPFLGQFKKGEIIDMHQSTAAACVKSGVVKMKTKKES